MKKLALALSVLASISSPAMAEGDAEAGKTKAIVCSACHGVDGNSMIDMYPKLAGQQATYLIKQLHDFRSAAKTGGKEGRNDPIMGGMAVMLSDQDIENVAAYYSSQAQTVAEVKDIPALGEQLYKGGDMTRGITACIACHGPEGKGMELAGFPAIAGQHANYLKIQLNKFSDTNRNNDLNGMMQDIANKLNSDDIEALSKYISSLK
ncbi:cytochrome c4 [Shewanella eurypsychrophilus]|uniref:Cytochrome c4 n=1 Tax=Shewanella eurypsychrophilus TaxID=2593656 RepID=A0ABX6V2I9_9GAMM|nr:MULTISPECIES: c-type cytochrome [Shewanella]QFU20502.1 c-type cytochrome [Shewanella sp. YLB-09]QFU20783.1 c-type cytochrome [Shewanella sp. YLB-09]QPG56078.1 cytochrome c4 [Shewanella eurypsychrophilus]